MGVPFIVPMPVYGVSEAHRGLPLNPVDVYLARLGIGSRRGMSEALDIVSSFILGRPAKATELDWARVRYNQTAAVRGFLVERYAPATCNRILSALRGVLKESWRLGLMNHDECARATDIASVRGEDERRGRALEEYELGKLFDTCVADKSIAGIRDNALLAILYGVGLRRSELVSLNLHDYDSVLGTLDVHGKGGTRRVGYVLDNVKTGLDAWVGKRENWDGPLFCPLLKGGRISKRPLTPEGVAFIFRKRGEQTGLKHFSLHDIRRTFITDLLSAGADLSIVQKLAGHRQISTTLIYDRRGENAKKDAAKLLAI